MKNNMYVGKKKLKKLRKTISYELEEMFDEIKRVQFDWGGDHDWVDTCDVYKKVFQKYRNKIKN